MSKNLLTHSIAIRLLITAFLSSTYPQAATSASTCVRPLTAVNTSHPTTVVGTGTPASCTEQALAAAINLGGIITFNCGAKAATIYLTQSYELRNDMPTTIDGNNLITLDGSRSISRMFWATSGAAPWYGGTPPYWRATNTFITFQNLTIANGRETTGTPIPPLPAGAPSNCSQGTGVNGSGGAIMVTDMILHVLNCKFIGNQAAQLGPDVGGGAIYALGALTLVVQDSTFQNNSASNSGAIGTLNSNLRVVDTQFLNNLASGNGANNNDPSSGCPLNAGQNEIGSGGNGGAIAMDGGQDTTNQFCGDTFSGNKGGAGALGGAIFRTADASPERTNIDQCEFDTNTSPSGGALYQHNVILTLTNSTFNGNSASTGGAVQADASTANLTNDTFTNNTASVGWGALAIFSNGGSIESSTFDGNVAGIVEPVLFASASFSLNSNVFQNNVLSSGGSTSCSKVLPGTGNISWPVTGATPSTLNGCATNPLQQFPMLEALAANGGFAKTMAIPSNSPANIFANKCPATDERGDARPPSLCAAGAYQPQ